MIYKRNQIDAALQALSGGPGRSARERMHQQPAGPIASRVKRLLELDREWAKENPKKLLEFGMAFYDELPRGTGYDVEYSAFVAFCLAVALELLDFGCKQKEVVEKIALIKEELKKAFDLATSVVTTDGRTRFGKDGGASREFSIFLVVRQLEASARDAEAAGHAIKAQEKIFDHEICPNWEALLRTLKSLIPKETHKVLLIELADLAARVVELLEVQPPVKRGRK